MVRASKEANGLKWVNDTISFCNLILQTLLVVVVTVVVVAYIKYATGTTFCNYQ